MSTVYVPSPGTGVRIVGNNVTSTIGVDDMLQKTNLSLNFDASWISSVMKPSRNSRCTEARNLKPEISERDRRFSLPQVLRMVSGRGMKAAEEGVTALVEIETIGEEAIECQPLSQQSQSKNLVISRKEKQKRCIGSRVCPKDKPPPSHASLKKPVIEIQNDNYQIIPVFSVKRPAVVRESTMEMNRESRKVQIHKYKLKNVVSSRPQRICGSNSLRGTKRGKNNQKKAQRPKALVVEEDDDNIPTPVEKSTSATRWISLSPKDENWARDMIESVEVIESTKNESTRAEFLLATASLGGKKVLSGSSLTAERSSCEGGSSVSKQKVVTVNYQTEAKPYKASPRMENEWMAPFSPHVFTFGDCDVASRTGYSF